MKKDLVTVCDLSSPEADAWCSPWSPAEGGGRRAGEEEGVNHHWLQSQPTLPVNASISGVPRQDWVLQAFSLWTSAVPQVGHCLAGGHEA